MYAAKIALLCVCGLIWHGCTNALPVQEQLVSIHIQDRNGLEETISTPERLQVWEQCDFLAPQPYKKIFRVSKMGGKHHSKITTYHSNGMPWQYLEVQEMRALGAFREWFANGQLHIEAHVVGGTADLSPVAQTSWLFDGMNSVWNEEGALIAMIPYEKGLLHGVSHYYYPSGRCHKEMPFQRGALHGSLLVYWENGTLQSKTEYQQGICSGLSLGFWSQGNPSWIEEYEHGLLERGVYYDVQGQERAEVYLGTGQRALFEGEELSQLVEFQHGVPEGLVQCFARNGELASSHRVKQGKKQGEERLYFLSHEVRSERAYDRHEVASPQLKLSVQWEGDLIQGLVRTWYATGTLQSQSEWVQNQKNGASCAWYCDGSLMLVEEYQQGELVEGSYFRRGQSDPVSRVMQGHGTATFHDEAGLFVKKVVYQNRRPLID